MLIQVIFRMRLSKRQFKHSWLSVETVSLKGKVFLIHSVTSSMFLAFGLLVCFLKSPVSEGKRDSSSYTNGLCNTIEKKNCVFKDHLYIGFKRKAGSWCPLCQLHIWQDLSRLSQMLTKKTSFVSSEQHTMISRSHKAEDVLKIFQGKRKERYIKTVKEYKKEEIDWSWKKRLAFYWNFTSSTLEKRKRNFLNIFFQINPDMFLH